MYVFLTVPDSGNGRIICQKIDENDSKEIKNYGGDNYFPRTLTYSSLRSLNTFNAPERRRNQLDRRAGGSGVLSAEGGRFQGPDARRGTVPTPGQREHGRGARARAACGVCVYMQCVVCACVVCMCVVCMCVCSVCTCVVCGVHVCGVRSWQANLCSLGL